MTQQEYERKKRECLAEFCNEHGFIATADVKGIFGYAFDRAYALGKQEKDTAKKTSALTNKEVYALESAISESESLMDGTLDEDYHKEQKNIIKALKRIIKKYEKE